MQLLLVLVQASRKAQPTKSYELQFCVEMYTNRAGIEMPSTISVTAHQVEILACFTQEEALHPILLALLDDIVQSGIPTPGTRQGFCVKHSAKVRNTHGVLGTDTRNPMI